MKRLQREVTVRCGRPTVAAALAHLDDDRARRRSSRELLLSARPDGRVTATRYPRGVRDFPAELHGRLEAVDRHVALVGTVREHVGDLLLPRLFAALAVFLGLIGVAVLVDGGPGQPVAYVCLVVAAACVVIARLGSGRRVLFDAAADDLVRRVESALNPPSGRR